MIKSKVSSPHYNFQVKSPYSNFKDPSNQIKVSSADRFNFNSKLNSSSLNLKRSFSENDFGDFNSGFEADFPQNSTFDHSTHPQAIHNVPTSKVISTTKRKFPQRVTSQNFFPFMNKKARDSQSTLRYLLKLSNNTFHATLKHEIEVLKKEKKSIENELSLHTRSILKILNAQGVNNDSIQSVLTQNQKLYEKVHEKDSSLRVLKKQIEDLHLKFMETPPKTDLKNAPKKRKSEMKKTSSEKSILKPPAQASSAPTFSRDPSKSKKQARFKSDSSILRRKVSQLFDKSSEDEKLSSSTIYSSSFQGNSDKTSFKSSSYKSSNLQVSQKNVATNYSANDFSARSESNISKISKSNRKWYKKFVCCSMNL